MFGDLPKPAFGGPGARTSTRERARTVLTGRPPHTLDRPATAPAPVISPDDGALAPIGAVDHLARLFPPTSVTRWHHTGDQAPAGSTDDHIGRIRAPATVVGRIVTWRHGTPRSRAAADTRTTHLKEIPCRPFSAPADRSPTSS
ncbi:hypothetical protein [Kitasatospora sp. NPDC088783]|uniref:hypothetical protein n=1 Tax=Kitasatospora sp. NPDC088783 TaxID=3364077 RepID=UPI0037F28D93